MVGQHRHFVGQSPGLVAEQPRDGTVQQAGGLGLEESGLPRAIGSEDDEAGGPGAAYALGWVVNHDTALAIKVSFPRPQSSGSKYDSDVYGGQQYAPLLALTVPD